MKMKKNFLPIAIDISGGKILIVGGGSSAFKKLQILQRHDAEVEVLAKVICPEIRESGIRYYEKEYQPEHLEGYLMVYSCTNDEILDRQIVRDGQASGVLVNIHDKPSLCRFISPAIYRSGNLSVAVSSNGEDVYESIRIRNLIQDYLQLNHVKL
jgi:precorrin-2 dehydrogenase / sirohydrochlorin ferrochelatase